MHLSFSGLKIYQVSSLHETLPRSLMVLLHSKILQYFGKHLARTLVSFAKLDSAAGLQDAVGLLHEMPDACRTLKAAHDILRHCVNAKRMDLAANLLDDLEGLGLRWNPWTWYLATCLQVRHLHQSEHSILPFTPPFVPAFVNDTVKLVDVWTSRFMHEVGWWLNSP